MTVLDAIETLSTLAQAAQTSGIVPIGPYAAALAILVAGSQAALQSGVLTPGENIEIDEVGDAFDAAMHRMRLALKEGNH